jgi:translation initiation factor 2B subunit (eIF-2B alpha/beta/delta family)
MSYQTKYIKYKLKYQNMLDQLDNKNKKGGGLINLFVYSERNIPKQIKSIEDEKYIEVHKKSKSLNNKINLLKQKYNEMPIFLRRSKDENKKTKELKEEIYSLDTRLDKHLYFTHIFIVKYYNNLIQKQAILANKLYVSIHNTLYTLFSDVQEEILSKTTGDNMLNTIYNSLDTDEDNIINDIEEFNSSYLTNNMNHLMYHNNILTTDNSHDINKFIKKEGGDISVKRFIDEYNEIIEYIKSLISTNKLSETKYSNKFDEINKNMLDYSNIINKMKTYIIKTNDNEVYLDI